MVAAVDDVFPFLIVAAAVAAAAPFLLLLVFGFLDNPMHHLRYPLLEILRLPVIELLPKSLAIRTRHAVVMILTCVRTWRSHRNLVGVLTDRLTSWTNFSNLVLEILDRGPYTDIFEAFGVAVVLIATGPLL